MNQRRMALPIMALALLTAGCSWFPAAGPDGTVSHSASPGGRPAVMRPQILKPTPGLRDSRPNPWVAARPAGADRLLVTFWGSPCLAVDRVALGEGTRTVEVTVFLGSKPGFGDACPDIAVYQGVYVSLSAPLGNRQIVDGAPGVDPGLPGPGGSGSGSPPDGTG